MLQDTQTLCSHLLYLCPLHTKGLCQGCLAHIVPLFVKSMKLESSFCRKIQFPASVRCLVPGPLHQKRDPGCGFAPAFWAVV